VSCTQHLYDALRVVLESQPGAGLTLAELERVYQTQRNARTATASLPAPVDPQALPAALRAWRATWATPDEPPFFAGYIEHGGKRWAVQGGQVREIVTRTLALIAGCRLRLLADDGIETAPPPAPPTLVPVPEAVQPVVTALLNQSWTSSATLAIGKKTNGQDLTLPVTLEPWAEGATDQVAHAQQLAAYWQRLGKQLGTGETRGEPVIARCRGCEQIIPLPAVLCDGCAATYTQPSVRKWHRVLARLELDLQQAQDNERRSKNPAEATGVGNGSLSPQERRVRAEARWAAARTAQKDGQPLGDWEHLLYQYWPGELPQPFIKSADLAALAQAHGAAARALARQLRRLPEPAELQVLAQVATPAARAVATEHIAQTIFNRPASALPSYDRRLLSEAVDAVLARQARAAVEISH
jgi:hypothetical protein